jgi:hypothetical protein
MNNLQTLNDVATQHTFWTGEAMKAWQDMFFLAFDLSEGSNQRFEDAQRRLELARMRANKEFSRLETPPTQ